MSNEQFYSHKYRHGLWLKQAAWEWVKMGRDDCNKNSETGQRYRKRWAKYALTNWRDGSWYVNRYKDYADV